MRKSLLSPKIINILNAKKLRALEGDISFSRLPGVYFSVSIFGGIPKIRWARLACFFAHSLQNNGVTILGKNLLVKFHGSVNIYVKQLVGVKSRTVHSLEV